MIVLVASVWNKEPYPCVCASLRISSPHMMTIPSNQNQIQTLTMSPLSNGQYVTAGKGSLQSKAKHTSENINVSPSVDVSVDRGAQQYYY